MLWPKTFLGIIVLVRLTDQAEAAQIGFELFVVQLPCAAERTCCPGPPGPDQFPAFALLTAAK